MATIEKYETKSGATLYRVRYRKPDGRQTDKRGFATKRAAQAYAVTTETAKLRDEFVAVSAGRVTVGQLGQAWLARQQGTMKPSGFRSYESAWRVHVAPRWSHVAIGDVRFTDIQAWASKLGAQRSPSLTQRAHSILSGILADAVRDRQLAVNPAVGVKLPQRSKDRRRPYLTAEQLAMLADESGRYRALVLLLGVGGLRWGEAAALRVDDIDFLRRRVHLTRNAVTVGGTRVVMGTLKTHESRTVALPTFVIDELSAVAADKERDDLLWSTGAGSPLSPPMPSTSWLAYAVKRCMDADPTFPRITAHALRHTAASLAISSGAHVKVVQRMLGHASAAMTLDTYADLFDADLDTVAENVGKMWARVGTTP
jgi:integrase